MQHSTPSEIPQQSNATATQLLNSKVFQSVIGVLITLIMAFAGYYADSISGALNEIKGSMAKISDQVTVQDRQLGRIADRQDMQEQRMDRYDAALAQWEAMFRNYVERHQEDRKGKK